MDSDAVIEAIITRVVIGVFVVDLGGDFSGCDFNCGKVLAESDGSDDGVFLVGSCDHVEGV